MYEGSQIEERKNTVTNKDGKAWCVECDRRVKYYTSSAICISEFRGIKYNYLRLNARCGVCGKEIYVPEINDANVHAQELAYKIAKEKL